MRFSVFSVFSILALIAPGCSSPLGEEDMKCSGNADCESGYVCDPEGDCVAEGDPLEIVTETLPVGISGESYAEQISARGGLPPYRWSILSTDAENLSIDDEGLLSSTALGNPGDYEVTIQVLDSSDHGRGKSESKRFTLEVAGCTDDRDCHVDIDGTCYEGVERCEDGVRQPCASTGVLSQDIDHCGASCGPCPQGSVEQPDLRRADACVDGRCRCGDEPECDEGLTCCIGQITTCADLTSPEHCNGCFHDCNDEVDNVQNALCIDGSCGYDACNQGWHDCDDPTDGCETPQGVENCSDCDDNCNNYLHVESAECIAGACTNFTCEQGWAQCGGDNGCQTDITQTANCGSCGNDCAALETNKLCMQQGGNYYCGCDPELNTDNPNPDANDDCHEEDICCDTGSLKLCVPHAEDHCASCEDACAISHGGPWCMKDSVDPVWACTCNDGSDDVDEACRAYPFSRDDCFESVCYCGSAVACEPPDACCQFGAGDDRCVDLAPDISENRVDHCGICGVSCRDGGLCDAGACECPANRCPDHSGAKSCVAGACVCAFYNLQPCPVGQYCVDNKGCCPRENSHADDCSSNCLNREGGRQWCDSTQCCTDCNDETTCDCADYGYHLEDGSPVNGYMPCPADKFCCEDEGCCDRPCHIPDKA
ncbi:MAG: hypothetical protein JXR96_28780, partial [Deltaproteobacteria bacterium]|nr:hypothetical protein [Deltaproteobacteria bacterium]